ncbi:MAG: IS3 family transposase, partial [Bacteroidales bacterium]|nr:IS3 family transposase [Candidatus Latescibacterota bacterium]
MIDREDKSFSVGRQCELLGLARSSYYRAPVAESEENLMYMRMLGEEYTRHPFLGSRGMRYYLRRLDCAVNRKRMQRLMRVMELLSIAPQKRTSIPAPEHKIYPYLLRKLAINRPDHVWGSDITYVRLKLLYPGYTVPLWNWTDDMLISKFS